MNIHNPRKRRLHGHEDATPVPLPQATSHSSTSIGYPRPLGYSDLELQKIDDAARILGCSADDLLAFSTRGHQRVSPPDLYPPPKRPRLSTSLAHMSAQGKQSPPGISSQDVDDRTQHDGDQEDALSRGMGRSRISDCIANFTASVCHPFSSCELPDYSTLSTSTPYNYGVRPPVFDEKSSPVNSQPWSMPQDRRISFAFDDSPVTSQFLPGYPVLHPTQPMAMQPSTRSEGMIYPETPSRQEQNGQSDVQNDCPATDHLVSSGITYNPPPERPVAALPDYSTNTGLLSPEIDRAQIVRPHRSIDIVQPHQRPPPARRGPFRSTTERQQTAETRRIGSCIRCRMQRIRCETNPDDKQGTCLTCSKVSNVKVWRLPCLRYKITDVKLFKPGQVKGYEWTRRWTEGVADDISQWASAETRTVSVTEGYSDELVVLRVRKFIPQVGDALQRTWVVQDGTRKGVEIPAFAIVNIEEARATYNDHIFNGIEECCRRVLRGQGQLIRGTYGFALKLVKEGSVVPKERELLKKVLELWMAIRMTTKSTWIEGQETLDMPRDIMEKADNDNVSGLKGRIPLPPVMGAQIELVLIHQIQSKLRREILESLQVMTQANNHTTWLTTYLVTFILLHNVSLLCRHDRQYAQKHGIKAQSGFAREEMVREYQHGANILLAYFHYCNKGIYPFSMECKEQDLNTLADLNPMKIKFVEWTRLKVEELKKQWDQIRRINDYENDSFFTCQLYEENWLPQPTI